MVKGTIAQATDTGPGARRPSGRSGRSETVRMVRAVRTV
jgi:hypothetical protein